MAGSNWFKNNTLWLIVILLAVGTLVIIADSNCLIKGAFAGNLYRVILFLLLVIGALFVWLFTEPVISEEGTLTADQKTRVNLVRFSYLFMFFALGASTIPFSFEWPVEAQKIEKKPISVFIGCSTDENSAKELQCDNSGTKKSIWIINIAGHAQSKPDKVTLDKDKPDTGIGVIQVNGGLVVPLYFVILALIGGAVSITRRIPEYQKQSASNYVGTEEEPKLDIGTLREKLVFQIVQFIAAPFIAVVAYYLIDPGQRVYSIVLGFIAGFASETILKMIRSVVNKIRPAEPQVARTGAVSGLVIDSATQKGIPKVKAAVIGQPSLDAETDANGHFVMHNIPVGEHALEASDQHGKMQVAKVAIKAGKVSVCHITLP